MILSDKDIRERVLNFNKYDMDRPLIDPFNEQLLQAASYDCTITNEIYFLSNINEVVDIREQSILDGIYEKRFIRDDGFILMPHSYVLVTLNETFYIPKDITAHLRPKTRFIRLGLYLSGQHINPDSVCKLNVGLYNVTDNPIRLYSNISIGQIIFEEMKTVPSKEKWYKDKQGANYSADIDFVGSKFQGEFQQVVNRELNKILRRK